MFGAGLIANGFTVQTSDFSALFWPQAMRGLAVMFCLLPATRLALEHWPAAEVPEASGLFNLMRNLGGAIGIAAIATILTERTPGHVAALVSRLQAGDPAAAALAGLPVRLFHGHNMGPVDPFTQALIEPHGKTRRAHPILQQQAWLLLGVLFLASLLLLPAMRRAN